MYDALKARLTERGLTIDQTKIANRQTIIDALKLAIDDNKAYIALTAPTAAQTAAQVKKLCRQNNRMIRLLANLLDAID